MTANNTKYNNVIAAHATYTHRAHTQVIYVSIDTLMETEKKRTSNHSIETIIVVDAGDHSIRTVKTDMCLHVSHRCVENLSLHKL